MIREIIEANNSELGYTELRKNGVIDGQMDCDNQQYLQVMGFLDLGLLAATRVVILAYNQ